MSFLQGSYRYHKPICPSLNLTVFIICFTSTFIHLACSLRQQHIWPYVCLPASKQHPSSHQSISIYHIAGLVSEFLSFLMLTSICLNFHLPSCSSTEILFSVSRDLDSYFVTQFSIFHRAAEVIPTETRHFLVL